MQFLVLVKTLVSLIPHVRAHAGVDHSLHNVNPPPTGNSKIISLGLQRKLVSIVVVGK